MSFDLPSMEQLVLRAAGDFGLDLEAAHPIQAQEGFVFHLQARCGREFALRALPVTETHLQRTGVEVEWLLAISRAGSPAIAAPVAAPDASYIKLIHLPSPAASFICVLFVWIPGVSLGDEPTEARLFELGKTSALLHAHGAKFVQTHERAVRFLTHHGASWSGSKEELRERARAVLSGPEAKLLDEAIEVTASEIDAARKRLDSLPIVHGDLHPWNVKVSEGFLTIFDFSDLAIAHPAQDVAVTCFHLQKLPESKAMHSAFRAGYENVSPWPLGSEDELRALINARRIDLMARAAALVPDPAPYLRDAILNLVPRLA